jgi:diphosphomevalonate decarboxylase
MMTKQDIVSRILAGRNMKPGAEGRAFAPANIALVKYWGKRDEELNLPVTSSLSVSLGELGSEVSVRPAEGADTVILNGQPLPPDSSFARRVSAYLDFFRRDSATGFHLDARNTIPTAAGFASSASGFAALVRALDQLFGWNLDGRELSILARLGSGSACRSIFNGFVEWRAGEAADGMDSYAEPLAETWPDLRMGLVIISGEEKAIGSREGMKRTVETSPLYKSWPAKVAADLPEVRAAIRERDFHRIGRTAESNALAMHATMIAAVPSVVYWKPESITAMRRVVSLREQGLAVYFTMDAGPNLKLLFEHKDTTAIQAVFPDLPVVMPFGKT